MRQLVEEEGKGRGKSQRQAVGHGGTKGHTIGQDVEGVRYQEEQVRGTPPRATTMAMTVGVVMIMGVVMTVGVQMMILSPWLGGGGGGGGGEAKEQL